MAKIQTLFGSLDEKEKPSFLDRMKQAVTRTRENLSERIEEVVSFRKEIDRDTLDDLEATLIGADLGTTTTHEVLQALREKADRKQIGDVEELKRLLKDELLAILSARQPAGSEGRGRPRGHSRRRGERDWQDHHHRQAGPDISGAGQDRAAVCRGYVSGGGHRAA